MAVKHLITGPVKRCGKWILNNSTLVQKVFRRVLTSDYATRMLLADDVAMLDLVSHAAYGKTESHTMVEQYQLERILKNPALHSRILDWVDERSDRVKELLRRPQLRKISDKEPDYLARLIGHHKLYGDLVDRTILEELFRFEETLDCMLNNYVLRERLLFDERILDRIVSDPRYVDELFSQEDVVEGLLDDERMLRAVLAHPSFLDHIFEHEGTAREVAEKSTLVHAILTRIDNELLLKHLDSGSMLAHLGQDTMLRHIGRDSMFEYLGAEAMLSFLGNDALIRHLGVDEMLKHITSDAMLDHLGNDALIRRLGVDEMLMHITSETMLVHLGNEALIQHLGADEMLKHITSDAMLDHLGNDALIRRLGVYEMLKHITPDAMLDYLGTAALLEHLGVTTMLNHLNPEQMLDHIDQELILKFLGPEVLLGSLLPEQMVAKLDHDVMLDHLGPEELLNRLSPEQLLCSLELEQMLKYIGVQKALDMLGEESLVRYLGPDRLFGGLTHTELIKRLDVTLILDEIDPSGSQIAAYLSEHSKIIQTIVRHENVLKQFLQVSEVRKRLLLLHGLERLSKLRYAQPAVVVSYPRSGSNFMQSILTHSTGMNNISIYGQSPSSFIPLLTVKSHAPSPEYLEDEYQRLLETESLPGRIILLKRDPRDVMISFYEYTQTQRGTTISQEDFLENISFFYASTIDKTHSRRIETSPLTVLEAYRKHIHTWFADRSPALPVLELSYEDMVTKPKESFRAALDYLEIDLPVAEAYLEVKVSLYSTDSRSRGEAYGWKHAAEKYAVLLEGVERLLAPEIQLLGYPLSSESSSTTSRPKSSTTNNNPSSPKKKATKKQTRAKRGTKKKKVVQRKSGNDNKQS